MHLPKILAYKRIFPPSLFIKESHVYTEVICRLTGDFLVYIPVAALKSTSLASRCLTVVRCLPCEHRLTSCTRRLLQMPHRSISSLPQAFKYVIPFPLLRNHRSHCFISVADYSSFLPEKQLLAEQVLTSLF